MVQQMMLFIRAVRTSDWTLHFLALDGFCKYFFAMDLTNYSRMIPLYLHEIGNLEADDKALFDDLQKGHWAVNKSHIPFCALGADEALEHQNRKLKVLGGLVGITQHPKALVKFFLTTPETTRLVQEASSLLNIAHTVKNHHHDLRTSVSNRHSKNVEKVYEYLSEGCNPFDYNGSELINVVSRSVFPEKTKVDVVRVSSIGEKAYAQFVNDRLTDKSIQSIWTPITKINLHLCKKNKKKMRVKINDIVTELKEDTSFLSKLLMISRVRDSFDLRPIISNYELSAVPRSMFFPDGKLIQCSRKSQLMSLLEKQVDNTSEPNLTSITHTKVAVLDAMAELHLYAKSSEVKSCGDLAKEFYSMIKKKYKLFDEIHVVFDTYLERSLKNFTRCKRQGSELPTQFKICTDTNIQNTTMKKLLSHSKTKSDLSEFLSRKIIEYGQNDGMKMVVSFKNQAYSSYNVNTDMLESDQEEADTKILLHCLWVSQIDKFAKIFIYSPDTDVFVLAVSNSYIINDGTYFCTGTGNNRRMIYVRDIYLKLGKFETVISNK